MFRRFITRLKEIPERRGRQVVMASAFLKGLSGNPASNDYPHFDQSSKEAMDLLYPPLYSLISYGLSFTIKQQFLILYSCFNLFDASLAEYNREKPREFPRLY